jgi:hypothetical protein
MTAPRLKGLILAVHPTSRGFGWGVFEGPLAPVDWGMTFAKRARNRRLYNRFERLLKQHRPAVLVLENFEGRTGASLRLCRLMKHLAECQGMDARVFPRTAIQSVFSTVGAKTRYEIAEVIRNQIDAFSHRMPRKRTLTVRADPRQALFDAAAVALTYFAVASHGHGSSHHSDGLSTGR